jgi:hypothetical protein
MYLRRSSREKISSDHLILCTPKKSQKIVNFQKLKIKKNLNIWGKQYQVFLNKIITFNFTTIKPF